MVYFLLIIAILCLIFPLLNKMLQFIKDLVNKRKQEREELWYWNSVWEEYRRWLNEFPAIAKVLDNMKNAVKGEESMDAGWPPSPNGPWTVSNLREHLRREQLNVSPSDDKFDNDWYNQFNKKHEQVVVLQARVAELERQAVEAVDLMLSRNRDVNALRGLCAEAQSELLRCYSHNTGIMMNNDLLTKLLDATSSKLSVSKS